MLASANEGHPNPVRQRMSSEDRRRAILETAIKLFADKGFRGTTTRELAAAAGVSEPVLYQHFETKRDLYTAIIDWKSEKGIEKFNILVAPFLTMNDDEGFFSGLAQLILDFHTSDPDYIRLIYFASLEGHEVAELCYQRQHYGFVSMIANYIQRRIDEGALRQVDPGIAANSFIGMVSQYAQRSIIHKCIEDPVDPDAVVTTMVRIFLDGMRRQSE
jgi:AcrR family transcriptional regulator